MKLQPNVVQSVKPQEGFCWRLMFDTAARALAAVRPGPDVNRHLLTQEKQRHIVDYARRPGFLR